MRLLTPNGFRLGWINLKNKGHHFEFYESALQP